MLAMTPCRGHYLRLKVLDTEVDGDLAFRTLLPGEIQDTTPAISVSSAWRGNRRSRSRGVGGEEKEERKLRL